MKTVLITGDENAVPAQYLKPIREAGIELACRKCTSPEEVEEFAQDADLVWMFGANPGLTAEVLKRLPKCKGIFRSGSGLDALPVAAAEELAYQYFHTFEVVHDRGRRLFQLPAADSRDGVVAADLAEQIVEPEIVAHKGVGVHDQHVRGVDPLEGEVERFGVHHESRLVSGVGALDELDPLDFSQVVERSVARGVVDDDHAHPFEIGVEPQQPQAETGELRGAVIGNDDR